MYALLKDNNTVQKKSLSATKFIGREKTSQLSCVQGVRVTQPVVVNQIPEVGKTYNILVKDYYIRRREGMLSYYVYDLSHFSASGEPIAYHVVNVLGDSKDPYNKGSVVLCEYFLNGNRFTKTFLMRDFACGLYFADIVCEDYHEDF